MNTTDKNSGHTSTVDIDKSDAPDATTEDAANPTEIVPTPKSRKQHLIMFVLAIAGLVAFAVITRMAT